MLFNSFVFIGFFVIVYALYLGLARSQKLQNRLLLVASYVFYGWWDWRFLGLLALSTVIDYIVARLISASDDSARRKRLLLVSIVANLVILGTFKYFNFFADSFVPILEGLGLQADFVILSIILPVGISFYTFQSMGYTIDVYRRKMDASRSFLDYALYVAFFPQLVAGPIERAISLLPQIERRRVVTIEQVNAGLSLILWGYFKKLVFADQLGLIADDMFNNHNDLEGMESIVGMLAFTGQIYGDFSGYSDIARGLSKLMGFELMVNFKLPYFATNPSDFWNRWHVSLSTWLRDYLYIPLGGSRGGKVKTYRNLLITMSLAGLWHGAAWNYVVWGAMHGVSLVSHRLYLDSRPDRPPRSGWSLRLVIFVQIVLTYVWWNLGMVIFRSSSIDQMLDMYTSISFTITDDFLTQGYKLLYFAAPVVMVELLQYLKNDLLVLTKLWLPVRGLAYGFFFVAIVTFALREPNEFIYFQF